MRDYKKYDVWKLGHELTLAIYKITDKFPESEKFRIVDQIRRAAYSIPSNIVEGCGRESDVEFKRYLVVSRGSANELEYFLILSRDLSFIDQTEFDVLFDQVNKVNRSITNLIKKL
ncbi:four helix bundle protein [Reichenbachiella agarivorans]|uniref:Four helix bundle protein n=1 Tax=Reichenbachiella agarivorans TaxID=2979464 RepID=A0ABY6CNL4_9BACT|nr:four helix bundle protein [Reichenbachiella agarivorans]UXP31630.1 four helix bundle protein [Reichenbachiella agarivorans]